jgi:diguanylate cyclase
VEAIDPGSRGRPTVARFTPERIARRRRVRFRGLAASGISYLVDVAILALYVVVGTTAAHVPLLYAGAAGLVTLASYVLYSTRIGEKAEDFFLSGWQVLVGTTIQLGFLAYAPEVGVVFITVLFLVFGFGALRVSVPKAAGLLGMATVGLAVVVTMLPVQSIVPLSTAPERWVTVLTMVAALGRATWLGRVGNTYRQILTDRSASLRQLTVTLEQQVADRTAELSSANAALERLVAERTAEIKTLQGVLPICAHCKKIRDDAGAWNQLEAYIGSRADVQFSHGICGQCMSEYYPDGE